MNWISAEICRFYPGMVWPLFMASYFMCMNVASGTLFSKEFADLLKDIIGQIHDYSQLS